MFDWTERAGSLQPLDTHRIIAHRYREAARRAAQKRVLEVGSGGGIGLHVLAAAALSAVACEYSMANLKAAATLRPRAALVCGDAHRLPFRDASFDVIVALAMIYYLDMARFLAEVRRVLTPGGKLFFCMSNKDVPGFVAAPHTTAYYSIPEMAAILTRAGFNATFAGAFPTALKSVVALRVRAALKDSAKALIRQLPQGSTVWDRWRVRRLGDLVPLPDSLAVDIVSSVTCEPLEAARRNRVYRVVYVDADLR
jgi:ubiquinone/menaquinone biosynthesis C-methylase UbiE